MVVPKNEWSFIFFFPKNSAFVDEIKMIDNVVTLRK